MPKAIIFLIFSVVGLILKFRIKTKIGTIIFDIFPYFI